jgi:hypothetical protein
LTRPGQSCHTIFIDTQPPTSSCVYLSIVDCEICARIPQQFAHDIDDAYPHIIPPEAAALQRVVEMNDESTHSYCISTTLLLKCPACGTYYYHNHYDDDGEHFMDPTSDTISLRRYDAVTAREFMERIAADPAGAVPNAMGRLVKAFCDGADAPQTRITAAGLTETQQVMLQELAELSVRYIGLIADLEAAVQQRPLGWHIKEHVIFSLCNHYYSQADWDTPRRLLLHHPDPEVRLLTLKLVMGIGTDDAPVMDIVHACRAARAYLEAEVPKQRRLTELADLLLDLALTAKGDTLQYDHGYGKSSYGPRSLRSLALYYLVVAAGRRVDLIPAIPALVGLLTPVSRPRLGPNTTEAEKKAAHDRQWTERGLNSSVCWVLRELAEKKRRAPRAIMDALEQVESKRRTRILKDENVQKLVETCEHRLGRRP